METRNIIASPLMSLGVCLIVGGFLGLLITNALKTDKKNADQRLMRYEECKQRGNDVEWCFITTKPRLYE